jgi:hypothetical protein
VRVQVPPRVQEAEVYNLRFFSLVTWELQLAQLNEQNAGKNYKYDYSYEEAAELI